MDTPAADALADAIAERLAYKLANVAELPDPERWMLPLEAAAFLGFAVKTLDNWRQEGIGPKFSRVSQRGVRYRRADLTEWMLSRRVGE